MALRAVRGRCQCPASVARARARLSQYPPPLCPCSAQRRDQRRQCSPLISPRHPLCTRVLAFRVLAASHCSPACFPAVSLPLHFAVPAAMADEAMAGGALTPGLLHAGPAPTHLSHHVGGAASHAHTHAHGPGHVHVHGHPRAHPHTVVVPAEGGGGPAPLGSVVSLVLPGDLLSSPSARPEPLSPLGHVCDEQCAGEGAVKYARHARPCANFLFVPAISNLSIQYNFADLSPALVIMTSCAGLTCAVGQGGDYPEPSWAKYVITPVVFVGSMAGMIGLGFLADVLGRKLGMVVTLSLVVIGALLSAFIPWGSAEAVYSLILISRFILGVGVGGIYPMAAAAAHEGTHSHSSAESAVGWTFW